MMKRISFMVLIAVVFISSIVYAQDFGTSIESIRERLLEGGFSVPASMRQKIPKRRKEQQTTSAASSSEASKSLTSIIKFPSAQEIIAKSNVAHIDPATYRLGAGDKLNVIFYGKYQQTVPVVVDPDGTIFVNPADPIYVKGLTIKEAQRKIYRVMKKYFKNFKVDLQIIGLRTFKIEVLGEVQTPGTYVVTPTVGVCDAIGLAGGLKEGASIRNVILKGPKPNQRVRVDLFKWYYMGKSDENRLLKRGQVVYVPLMKNKITIDGAFRKRGTFEVVSGERVSDVVKMVSPTAKAVLSEAKITRLLHRKENLKIIPVNIAKALEHPNSEDDPPLIAGDVLFVPSISVFLKKIKVIGELNGANFFKKTVNRLTGQEEIIKVGSYDLSEGERVKDVVVALGGVTVKADLEKARVERPIGGGRVKVIPVNLRKLLYENDESQNIKLKAGDTFIVPAAQTNIYILGEIRNPGAYQYNVGNKIKEYIALAGGPTRRARMRQTRVIQYIGGKPVVHTIDLRSILTGNLTENFELRPGDVIYIPYAEIVSYKDVVRMITDLIVLRQIFK